MAEPNQTVGDPVMYMFGAGDYDEDPFYNNFFPGFWRIYISGGGGQGNYASFSLHFRGPPIHY